MEEDQGRNPLKIRASLGLMATSKIIAHVSQSLKDQGKSRTRMTWRMPSRVVAIP